MQATGGGSAGLGGAIFNQGTLSIVDSTLTGNAAQGGAGGSIRFRYVTLANGQTERYTSHSGSGGAGLNGGGADSQAETAAAGEGGGPNGGVGGVTLYPDGRSGGFGGGGGYGGAVSYFYGNAGSGGFGGGGGGSEGETFAFNLGTNGGNGGFGGGGGGGHTEYEDHKGVAGTGGLGGGDGVGALGGGGAGMVGAVFNWGGTVTITNSTLTGNAARGGVGGSDQGSTKRGATGEGDGAAIISFNGTLTIADSTLSKNAAYGGRGIVVFGLNRNATALINNTIIGQSDTTQDDYDLIVAGENGKATVSGQSNLIDRSFFDPTTTTNGLVGTVMGDPKLGPLQDNTGPTQTMSPLPGSPVIDAGNNAAIAAGLGVDQRGAVRIRNGTVDIGAVETRAAQTISFDALADRTYGDADFAIGALPSSGLPINFTATGNATVYQTNGTWYVHITGAGTVTITATADGNANYEAAAPVSQTLTIAKAASFTTTYSTGPFTYDGGIQFGGSGVATGVGGLNTTAVSLSFSANPDGTGFADLINAGTYCVIAHYAGDANHLPSTGNATAIVINKATATVNVTGYTGTYDGSAHGATGTAIDTLRASVGTLDLGATFTNVTGSTAHWTFDGRQNYVSQQGDVAIKVLAKHITATITAANKVYDGKTSATVTRSLIGVVGTDAVSLTCGTATFANKNTGTWKVSLAGAKLSGAAAGNYVLDSVATTTAMITPRPLTGTAATQAAFNVAKNGDLSFLLVPTRSGIVDGQTAAQLFNGTTFDLAVGGKIYNARAKATVFAGVVVVNFRMTAELKALLAANTTAKNASSAKPVAIYLWATSKDYNYAFNVTASTKLFNTTK